MSLHTMSWADESLSVPAGVVAAKLTEYLAGLRPAHPVSILDVSSHAEPGLELARWVRRLPRKVRLMTYDWRGGKAAAFHAAAPEVLVEKGTLPGVHFSAGSFDFVVGADVLAGADGPQRSRALTDLCRTALRLVLLAETAASPTAGEIADLFVGLPGKPACETLDNVNVVTINTLLT